MRLKVSYGPCAFCGAEILARTGRKPKFCSQPCASKATAAAKSATLKKWHADNPTLVSERGRKISATKQARFTLDSVYRNRLIEQARALPATTPESAAKRIKTIKGRYTAQQRSQWAAAGGVVGGGWNKGLTKETDARVAKQAKALVGHPPFPGSGRGKGGVRQDLGLYLRSTWEADVARVLNLLGIQFQYEPQVFLIGPRTYRPDFYLPDLDIWVEVSGWVSEDKKQKLASMAHFYPDIQIAHISRSGYAWLATTFAHQIPTWEGKPRGIGCPVGFLQKMLIRGAA